MLDLIISGVQPWRTPLLYQIHDHMADMSLYPIAQSAYRENLSTETALLKCQKRHPPKHE